MLDRVLRTPKQKLLKPLARTLDGYLPTSLTLVSFGLGLLAAALVTQGLYGWGLGFWLANRLLDGLDGEVARQGARQSDWGGYLDILCDFAVYTLLPLALAVSAPSREVYLSLALLLGSFYLNGGAWLYLAALLEKRRAGAAAEDKVTSITMPSGLIEGSETILFYTLFLLFPGTFATLATLMACLVLVTAGQRVVWARALLK